MKSRFFFYILLALLSFGCGMVQKGSSQADGQPVAENEAAAKECIMEDLPSGGRGAQEASPAGQGKPGIMDCFRLEKDGMKVLKAQTFFIDFKPFKQSCFVTFHDGEVSGPPLGSEFFIYRDGEEVFDFPSKYNGITAGCWIEAVAFEDLNRDGLNDIIIAAKCSAKSGPYNENMVYINTGSGFKTNEDTNYKLAEFSKIKEIKEFAFKNQQLFFE